MATEKVILTQEPLEIGAGEVFISSKRDFRFAYSDTAPTDLKTSHHGSEVYTNGSFGKLWAWSATQKETVAFVSKGV